MKNKKILFALACLFMLPCCILLASCENVVPCAWVKLDSNVGYIVYTSNMYSDAGDHIYLYETQEDAENDQYHANYALSIAFLPRILGKDTIEGQTTTTVDITSSYEMTVYINKNKSIYSESKKIYLNGTALNYSYKNESTYSVSITYIDFGLVRGNPNGQINNYVNVIEYK